MSDRLKAILYALVEKEKQRIDDELPAYADALSRCIEPAGLVLTIQVEGVDQNEHLRKVLDDLCKVGLVMIDTHYTHRNIQLTAHATPLGEQIGDLLREWKR